MGIFNFINRQIEKRRSEKEQLINQLNINKKQASIRDELICKFNKYLSSYNNEKNKEMKNLYGVKLYYIYNELDNKGKEFIESNKGENLILLINKEHQLFIEKEKQDSELNHLTENSKKIKMISALRECPGVLFIDKEQNLYCGDFFDLQSVTYCPESWNDSEDCQVFEKTYYLGPECGFDNDTYTYYEQLDVLVKSNETSETIDEVDCLSPYGYTPHTSWSKKTIYHKHYYIEYNISKKVHLFDENARQNKYNESMKLLYEKGIKVSLSEKEKQYILNKIGLA